MMSEKIIDPKTKIGYPSVVLFNGTKKVTRAMHRLIAIQFIPNPQNKKEVNHINKNIFDYSIDNLEWVTRSENMKHAKNNS
jgi:hypothetical protein